MNSDLYRHLPVMNSNRHTVATVLRLPSVIVDRLRSEQNLRIMLYCAVDPGHFPRPIDIAFPSQVEVKVNDEVFQGNLRGIKKKSGTTRPADITPFITKQHGFPNRIMLTYAATDKVWKFFFCHGDAGELGLMLSYT